MRKIGEVKEHGQEGSYKRGRKEGEEKRYYSVGERCKGAQNIPGHEQDPQKTDQVLARGEDVSWRIFKSKRAGKRKENED